jgi:very-short-patch-repair endonuclease
MSEMDPEALGATGKTPSGRPFRGQRSRSCPSARQNATRFVAIVGASRLLPVAGRPAERIAAIAATQRGRVSRRQLLAAGISKAMIETRLAGGSLRRVHLGVYAVGHDAPIPLGAETAALLAVGPDAVLSHETAAALWRLRPPPPEGSPVHITLLSSGVGRRAGLVLHRTRSLAQRDVGVRERLPLTSPARTLLDLAATLRTRELERAIDEALTTRIATGSQLADLLARTPAQRKGRRQLAALLEHRRGSTITRSDAEEVLLDLVRTAALPDPECNVALHGFTFDAVWRADRIVVEVDSYQFHMSKFAFARDRRKDAVLRQAGWEVMRITWDQLEHEPYAVVARLATTLARAAAA